MHSVRTFAAAPDTIAFAAEVATDFTADPTTEDATLVTAGIADFAALALADANISITIVNVLMDVYETRILHCY